MSLVLKIDGREYQGWKSAIVVRGLEQMAGNFTLAISERWPESSSPGIRAGAECVIEMNGIRVITGYIDDIMPSYDATSHEIQIRGRSKTCDLVDCSILKADHYTDRKIEQIAEILAKPFGIDVIAEADTGKGVTEKTNVGETPAEIIGKIALMRGLIAFDDAAGNLVFTRAGKNRADRALISKVGETNVLTGKATISMRDRFSLYRCIGQNTGDDYNYGIDASAPKGEVLDKNASRYRPIVVFAEKAADSSFCKERATWERAWRAGESVELLYTVNGWEHAKGKLWEPNLLVAVEDEVNGIYGTFLISKVSLSMSDAGEIATLSCVLPEAYSTEPTMPITSKNSKFWQEIAEAGRAS